MPVPLLLAVSVAIWFYALVLLRTVLGALRRNLE